eukprot:PhF_6_TR28075/c0_g1_i1/m.41473/K01749/hemC, HMBS; hydroxymethylbilane synthase
MNETTVKKLRIVTRNSPLALAQTHSVMDILSNQHNIFCEIASSMETSGDKILDKPLPKIGDKGLFTQELEEMLLSGGADIAVHSLKDLPTSLPPGLCVGAVLSREDPSDVVVFRDPSVTRLEDLPRGAVIGTSSLRRKAVLTNKFPHFTFKDVRGNVGTRVSKLKDAEPKLYDAIILAAAGLKRLGVTFPYTILPDAEYFHAVGQAALAVECRCGDERVLSILRQITCPTTLCMVTAERSMLAYLQGGCHVPIAVFTELLEDGKLVLKGIQYSPDDGVVVGMGEASGPMASAEDIGIQVGQLMQRGVG